ncbi:MAG: beta-galactosidase trimerization domain-containing protein, partial [Victivallales bacterium]|nr:beta-galactosidase trimerization domain-containing protein [Victivallales bacterium]
LVKHRGEILLRDIAALVAEDGVAISLKSDEKLLPDGTKVWNVWSEEYESRYRMEVVLPHDGGSVEISILGEAPAWPKYSKRQLRMSLPLERFQNTTFKGVTGVSRSGHNFRSGVFDAKLEKGVLLNQLWRFLALDGGKGKKVIFDFDPIGPTNPCPQYPVGVIYGFARLDYQGDVLNVLCGSDTREEGGFTGAKIVLREGGIDDFSRIHVLPHYHYNQHVTPLFYDSFGAEKTGRQYQHLDTAKYDAAGKRGWMAGDKLRKVTGSEGALYSHVAGSDGVLRYRLPGKGLYLFCLYMGNSNNTANNFALDINGRTYLEKLSVPSGKIAMVTVPVWINGDSAEIKFTGDFILSTVSVQYFISEKEDFSFQRAFWFTNGFEPANAFHSEDYQRPLKLEAAVKIINMPAPGQETSRPPKTLPRPVDKVDMSSDKMAWSRHVNMRTVNGVRGALDEYRDPVRMQRLIEESKKNGVNVFMISGIHGRQGFPGRLEQNADDLKVFAEAAHKAGIKVIDHHDATFMENWEQGLRVMAERAGEMAVCIYDGAPTPHFCLSNENFTRTYRKYLKNILKVSKIDGFQIDELSYYRHGCLCFSCREAFERDTNWQLPMNELDSRLNNYKSDLRKMWFTWRKVNMANWWIGLRHDVMDVAPDMFLSTYCTHREQLQSLPGINLPFDLLEQARGIALFGSEVMPRNPYYNARSLFVYRKIFNMFCIGYNTPPIWVWYYTGNWDVYYFCWAVSNMLQQSPMVDGISSRPEGGTDFLAFGASKDNEATQSSVHAAQAAILLHPDSRDYNTGITYEDEFGGFAQMFQNCHIPYDIIEPRALHNAETMKRYKVLFVISASCLNDEDIKVIKAFAAQGGTVLLSTVSGLNNQWGNRRGTWGFADVFGFSPYPHFHKLKAVNQPGEEEVTLDDKEAKYYLFYKLRGNINADEILLEGTALDDGCKVPLIVGKMYQKGKIYYSATCIPAEFFVHECQVKNQWPYKWNRELEKYFQRLFCQVAQPAAVWQVKAPRLVHSELYYRNSGGYVAHFLNATGTELEKGQMLIGGLHKDAWPTLNEDVTFIIRDSSVKKAYAVSPDFAGRKPLAVKNVVGKSEVTLPKEFLKAYAIVHIE